MRNYENYLQEIREAKTEKELKNKFDLRAFYDEMIYAPGMPHFTEIDSYQRKALENSLLFARWKYRNALYNLWDSMTLFQILEYLLGFRKWKK